MKLDLIWEKYGVKQVAPLRGRGLKLHPVEIRLRGLMSLPYGGVD